MMFTRSRLSYCILGVALCSRVLASFANAEETSQSLLESKIRGAFFGALMADALCLGSHYEYDAPKIHQAYQGILTKYMAPGEAMGGATHGVGWGKRNYHPGTVAGDQTDYGEYNIVLLEHFAASSQNTGGTFDVDSFLPLWKKRLMSPDWKQWRCTQTKRALQMHQKGYPSNQLGGPSNAMALRYAGAFAVYDNEEELVTAAKGSMFTHSEKTALLGNEFFARLTFRVLRMNEGEQTLRSIIEQLASESDEWIQKKVAQAIAKFEEATNPNTDLSKEQFVDDLALTSMAGLWDVGKSEPIKVGKASPTEGTLPGALYFILKYENDLVAAAKANAMVGGDNASRSIAVGMVLGAYHGVDAIPKDLKETLNAWNKCETMLNKLPLLVAPPAGGGGVGDDGIREEL